MTKNTSARTFIEHVEARITALEILVRSVVFSMPDDGVFVRTYEETKRDVLDVLLNNSTVTDAQHDEIEEILSDYERAFGIVRDHHNPELPKK